MKKLSVILILLGLIVSGVAQADISENTAFNRHTGFYAEGDFGTNLYYVRGITVEHSDGSIDKDLSDPSYWRVAGYGFSASVGYNIIPYVGFEVGYLQQFGVESSFSITNVSLPYLAAKFTIPIGNRFAFLAKVGGGCVIHHWRYKPTEYDPEWYSYSSAGVWLYSSLGASYALNQKIDLNVQWQGHSFMILDNFGGLLSAGLTYHF